ncbi:MAG: hypothetical protein ABIM89_14285 [Mycobacteriales bacterium]
MSYEEKGTWLFLWTTIAGYAAYIVRVVGRADGVALEKVDYERTLLWSIGFVIAANIVGRIALAIFGEVAVQVRSARTGVEQPSDDHNMDVRDKEINRFGEYVGGIVLGTAMIVPFGLALGEVEHFWIANAMYMAFVLSGLVSASIKLVAYRRGF